MVTTQEPTPTAPATSTEELRTEMFGILDELVTGRSERASQLKAKFDALWNQIGSEEPTVH